MKETEEFINYFEAELDKIREFIKDRRNLYSREAICEFYEIQKVRGFNFQ